MSRLPKLLSGFGSDDEDSEEKQRMECNQFPERPPVDGWFGQRPPGFQGSTPLNPLHPPHATGFESQPILPYQGPEQRGLPEQTFGTNYQGDYKGYESTHYQRSNPPFPPQVANPQQSYGAMNAPPPPSIGGANRDNLVYASAAAPSAHSITPNSALKSSSDTSAVGPLPAATENSKKEAIEQELAKQKRTLAVLWEEYIRRKIALTRELNRLKEHKRELLTDDSVNNDRILKENSKLQGEILQKLISMDYVIEMLSNIIGDKAEIADLRKDTSYSAESPKNPDRRKRSGSRSHKKAEKVKAKFPKVNIVHYDPELHWCSVCKLFPQTATEFLTHLHSEQHKVAMKAVKDSKTEDELMPPPINNAPSRRVPIRAIEPELAQQKRTPAVQWEEYIRRKIALTRELNRLKEDKRELLTDDSVNNDRILKENSKLQGEILQKLKSMDYIIEMLSNIIGDKAEIAGLRKETSYSAESPKNPDKRKRSGSRSHKKAEKVKAKFPKVNIVHYDPDLHWCSVCEVYPQTATEFLTHLHSEQHKFAMKAMKDSKTEDELMPPPIKNAPSRRVPIREMVDFLQFNNDCPEDTEVEAEAGLENPEGPIGTALTWTEGLTKQQLDLYKSHHKQVGRSIPSLKKLYELLTKLLNAQQKSNLKPSQVEYKMRNLLKGYKAVVDNNSKTGRGKKFFRFETEMGEIFGQSKTIHPSILLSERRVVLPKEPVNPAHNSPGTSEPDATNNSEVGEHREMTPPTNNADLQSTSSIPHTPPRATLHVAPSRRTPSRSILRKSPNSSSRRTRTVRDARLAEIVAMRKEKAEFYKQHLEIIRKDAEQREIMTAVMTERNAILRKFLDSYHPDLK